MTPSGPISVLWVEVKKRRPSHWGGVAPDCTLMGRGSWSWPRPRAPAYSSLLSQRPSARAGAATPAHTPGEPPSHSPPSYSIARRKGIRLGLARARSG